jgi:hypothetical protein
MELNPQEVTEIQEKLLLVHRFISQEKRFKNFYYRGIDVKKNIPDDQGMISKLMELDDAEELLKNCIIELEGIKTGKKSFTPEEFNEFLIENNWNFLFKKYGMKNIDDVGKLDLERLLELL